MFNYLNHQNKSKKYQTIKIVQMMTTAVVDYIAFQTNVNANQIDGLTHHLPIVV
jgi:hypothetical protein